MKSAEWKAFMAMALVVSLSMSAMASSVSVINAKMMLMEYDNTVMQTVPLNFGSRTSEVVRVDHTQSLKIRFRVVDEAAQNSIHPHQAFVRLTSLERNSSFSSTDIAPHSEAFFTAVEAQSMGELEAIVKSDGIAAQIGAQGGRFKIALLLASSSPEVAEIWEFGEVIIAHRPSSDGTQPPPPKTALEMASEPKPEIEHIHRQPEKSIPFIISLGFVGLVIIPTTLFVMFVLQSGELRLGKESLSTDAFSLAFHLGTASILLLLSLFWLRLNLVQTLPMLGVLEVLTYIIGKRATASRRAKQD